jgi:hypothetical protein
MTSLDSVLLGILESDIPQVLMYTTVVVVIPSAGAGDWLIVLVQCCKELTAFYLLD